MSWDPITWKPKKKKTGLQSVVDAISQGAAQAASQAAVRVAPQVAPPPPGPTPALSPFNALETLTTGAGGFKPLEIAKPRAKA